MMQHTTALIYMLVIGVLLGAYIGIAMSRPEARQGLKNDMALINAFLNRVPAPVRPSRYQYRPRHTPKAIAQMSTRLAIAAAPAVEAVTA